MLSYKPQFGLLVPVALLAARQWRTIAAAAATVFVLAVVTELLFGAAIWTDWLAALPVYSRQFAAESSAIVHLMPTILAALLQFGLPASVAGPAQWLATLVMAAIGVTNTASRQAKRNSPRRSRPYAACPLRRRRGWRGACP